MSTASLEGCRVLVVEDDYMIAQDMRGSLEKAGAIVVGPVATVGRALQLVDREPALDAAILDVNLGGEKSFPVAEVLEARSVPFLFATGYESGDVPLAWRWVRIVMKPIQITSLAEMLGTGKGR